MIAAISRTALCLSKVTAKAIRLIDLSCFDTPECYTLDGAGWVDLVQPQIEALEDGLFCSSP